VEFKSDHKKNLAKYTNSRAIKELPSKQLNFYDGRTRKPHSLYFCWF